MNLKQLQYFLALAQQEHYRKAAADLYITEPSLNRAIRELEKELGVLLFEKRGRNIYLNKYGRIFLPHVQRSLQELDKGIDLLKAYTLPDEGTIKVGFIYTMGYTLVPQLITQFQSVPDHQRITFDFTQGTTATLLRDLKSEAVDIVFCSATENEPDIQFYPVAEEELVVAVPKNHPLSNKTSIFLKELEPYPFIAFNQNSGLHSLIAKLLERANSHPSIICHMEEDNAMAGFVAAGYGVSILPNFPTLKHYPLTCLTISDPMEKRYLYMAMCKHTMILPVVDRFKRFVLSQWQPHMV